MSGDLDDQPAHGRARSLALALALAGGAAFVLALPPIGWWPLGPVGVALLGMAWAGRSARSRALAGFAAGLVLFGLTLRWATIFTLPGYVLLVVVQAAFLAVAGVLMPARRGALLALPGVVVLIEWVRYNWPLSGLPLSGLDLSQAATPNLALAALGGPLLLTLAAAASGALLAAVALVRDPRLGAALLLGAIVLPVAGLVAPTNPGTAPDGRLLRVATVQGGGARGIPGVRADSRAVFDRHLEASEALDPPLDLVVWPEDVIQTRGAFAASPQREPVAALARRLGTTLVVGVIEQVTVPDGGSVRSFRNLAVALGPGGEVVDDYDKVIRVPFGEYVPLRALVGQVADLSLIPRDAIAGEGPGTLQTPAGRLGVSISFEGLFASRARSAVRDGASALLNPTNAASYVTADIPAQQVAAARLRAVETGRTVLLAAPTGPSAIVGFDGEVRARSELEAAEVLTGTVQPRAGLTPYTRIGDLPVLALAALLLIGGQVLARRDTR